MSDKNFLPKDLLEFENKIILNSFLRRIKESVCFIFISTYKNPYNTSIQTFNIRLDFNDFTDEQKSYKKDMVSEEFLNLLILNIKNIPDFLKLETRSPEKDETNITLINISSLEKILAQPLTHITILKRKPYLYNNQINFLFLNIKNSSNLSKYMIEYVIPLCEKDISVINTLPEIIKDEYHLFIKTNLSRLESVLAFYKNLYDNLSDTEKLLVEIMEPNCIKY